MAMEDIGGVPAVMQSGSGGWGGDMGGLIALFAIFALFGGGGVLGGRGETALSNEMLNTNMQAGFNQVTTQANFDTVDLSLAQIQGAVNSGNFATLAAIKDNGFAGVIATKDALYAQAMANCETNRNIDSVKTQMAADTCAILNSQLTLAKDAELRGAYEKIAEQSTALSEQRIIAAITNNLQPPRPVPAYASANPYEQYVAPVRLVNGCGINGFNGVV